jgi:hypothetical protein
MTHPLFRKEIFVETAFAKRLQKMLYASWDNRAFHLLVADPGEGLTMTIRDLQKRAGGRSVLAVNANSQMTYFAKLKLTHPQCQLRIAPPSQDLV